MSFNPIDTEKLGDHDVDPGTGVQINNNAHSMNRYGASSTQRKKSSIASSNASKGMNTYGARSDQDKRISVPAVTVMIIAVVAAIVAAVIAVSSCSKEVSDMNDGPSEITFEIPRGYGTGDIATLLKNEGVIDNPTAFGHAVQSAGAEGSLQAGTYTISKGTDYDQIVRILMAGPESSGLSITIPEGFTVEQTAQAVSNVYQITYDEFMAQALASNYVEDFPFLADAYNDSLEGFLFPKTYTFASGVSADEVIRTMLRQFSIETQNTNWSLATWGDVELSEYEVIIAASLVEKETAVPAERPLVASVILNRLNDGWYLQIDAPIHYVTGLYDLLYENDTYIDSPYNLYQNPGLCPGPICSPSMSSINAVLSVNQLDESQRDYYFYVASAANDGTHVFCTSEEEFAEALAAYNESIGLES